MTIKECTHEVCREMGMDESEIQAFFAYTDANSSPDSTAGVNQKTLEQLPEAMRKLFWDRMREEVPLFVKRFRDDTQATSVTE